MKLHDMVNYVFKTAFPQYEMGREVFEGSHIWKEKRTPLLVCFLFIFHIFTQQLLLRKRTSVIEDPISFYY